MKTFTMDLAGLAPLILRQARDLCIHCAEETDANPGFGPVWRGIARAVEEEITCRGLFGVAASGTAFSVPELELCDPRACALLAERFHREEFEWRLKGYHPAFALFLRDVARVFDARAELAGLAKVDGRAL